MKKLRLFLALTALVMATSADAQIKFGLRGGVDVQRVSLDKEVFNTDNRLGFYIGPTLQVHIPIVGLEAELSALYHNWEVDADATLDDSQTMHYVDVPLTLKYNIGLFSVVGAYVAAGPQLSFNVGEDNLFDHTYEVKDSYFSVNLGAGIRLMKWLQIGYNYNWGVGKTAELEVSKWQDYIEDDLKVSSHQITVSVLF